MMNRSTATFLLCLWIAIPLPGCATNAPSAQDKKPTWLLPAEKDLLGGEATQFAEQQLACGLGPLSRRASETPSDSRLQMSVSLKDQTLVVGQPLTLRVKLTNRTSDTLSINTGQPALGFQARIFDVNGKVHWGRITRLEGSFGRVLKEHFREIGPGKSIQIMLPVKAIADFETPQSHAWKTVFPGKFVLSLCFSSDSTSWYDRDTKKQEDVPNAWTGYLVSNVIQYEVKKN